jgi:hypothetical protein
MLSIEITFLAMAANPFFSGRIPQELFDHIEKRIEKSGESKTDILVQALAIYTGFDLPIQKEITQSPLAEKVEMLTLEVELLKEKFNELELYQKRNKEIVSQSKSNEKTKDINISQGVKDEPNLLSLITDTYPDNKNDNKEDKGKKTTEIKIVNTGEAAKILRRKTSEIMEWKANEELPKTIGDITIEFDGYNKKGEVWKITSL